MKEIIDRHPQDVAAIEFYKEYLNDIEERLNTFNKTLNDAKADFKDSQRATAAGIQNVYNKFIEFEERQRKIETLLNSERIHDLIRALPNEFEIRKLLTAIESTEIGALSRHLKCIKEDLKELSNLFN